MTRSLGVVGFLSLFCLLAACGGGGGGSGSTTRTLQSISLSPPDSTIAAGLTDQYTATAVYSDGSKTDVTSSVTWSSSNSNVASISGAGLATTLSSGSTTISAALQNVAGSTTLTVTSATLVSIGVTASDASLAGGLTEQFKATGVYTDDTTHDLTATVTWSSSATSVATISNGSGTNGLARAVSPGTATITATLGAISGATSLTVTAATLVSIGVTPANATLAAGTHRQYSAMGVYTDGSTHDLSTSVAWTSSTPAVAIVGTSGAGDGLVAALAAGSTTIMAAFGGVSGSTGLTVTGAALVSIAVTPANPTIAKGLQQQFTATGTYTDSSTQNLTAQAIWSSSDPAVATINNSAGYEGRGSALSPGTATISASLGSISGSTNVTVTAAMLVSIGVTPPDPIIALGTAEQLTATGVYTDNTTRNLTASVAWASSTPAVATVSNATGTNGLAVGAGIGSTTVTAALGGITGGASLTVTAATLVSIAITPADASIADGTHQQLTATGTYTDNMTQNLTAAASWSTSNGAVATVSNANGSNGLVTAAGQGTATLSATVGNVSGSTALTVTAATLTALDVTPTNPRLANGLNTQFIATGIFSNNSTQNLTAAAIWTSSDTGIALVSNAAGENGAATALSPGSATISAALNGITGSSVLTVSPATLASIAVTPPDPSIAASTGQQFTALGTYTDNSVEDLTTTAAWSSSNGAVASISNAAGSYGFATASGAGSAVIQAAVGGVSGATDLTVTNATLVSINVTPTNPSIADGIAEQFTATGTFSDNSTQDLTAVATWISSNAAVASISNAAGSNGIAAAVGPGSATITATLGGESGTAGLTVTNATLVSIVVTPSSATIAAGTTEQLTATGTFTDGSTQDLTQVATWISSAAAIAAISNAADSNGLATGVGVGTASMSATFGGVSSAAATLTVTAAERVYVVNLSDDTLSEYQIGAGGLLTLLNPPTVTVGANPWSVTIAASGHYAYVANYGSNTLSQFAVTAGGVLAPLDPPSVPSAGVGPYGVTVDPSNRYAYATDAVGSVSQYTIAAGGELVPMLPPSVPAGADPSSVAIDPSGSYAYVANQGGNTLSQYTIGAGGALAAMGTATVAAGSGPHAVMVDPRGSYVYAVNSRANTVSEYTIGDGGALVAAGSIATGNEPYAIAVDPSGSYVYVANATDDTVSEYTIGAGGALSAVGTVPTGSGPYAIAIDPTGQYVYITNFNDATVSQYSIGAGGVLTALGTVTTGNGPFAIVAGL